MPGSIHSVSEHLCRRIHPHSSYVIHISSTYQNPQTHFAGENGGSAATQVPPTSKESNTAATLFNESIDDSEPDLPRPRHIQTHFTSEDRGSVATQVPPTPKAFSAGAPPFNEPIDKPKPDSPPPRRIGLRRTVTFDSLPHTISQEHSIFASNDFEIDEVAPSEDKRIAEAALQDDQNVSKYQSTFLFSSGPVVDDYASCSCTRVHGDHGSLSCW